MFILIFLLFSFSRVSEKSTKLKGFSHFDRNTGYSIVVTYLRILVIGYSRLAIINLSISASYKFFQIISFI